MCCARTIQKLFDNFPFEVNFKFLNHLVDSKLLKKIAFSQKLIKWYEINKRDLPWRHTQDPYPIWLSEIILQQTRVVQGRPYYEKFIETYPQIQDMAQAPEAEILRLWQGLGYYSRARNMHGTAKYISDELDGKFPSNYQEIRKLKGIGDYTAAAISSFAFGEQQAVLDGNVFRVLARIFGISDDILSGKGKKKFAQLAADLLPEKQSSVYNQAIMEFGALQCIHRNPDCKNCIFSGNCFAQKHEKQAQFPVKIKKTKHKERHFLYVIFEHEYRLLMKPRLAGDIWQGLYDFPLHEKNAINAEIIEKIYQQTEKKGLTALMTGKKIKLATDSTLFLEIRHLSDTYKHTLSHQKIYAKFMILAVPNLQLATHLQSELGGDFYELEAVDRLPKPILIADFLKKQFV